MYLCPAEDGSLQQWHVALQAVKDVTTEGPLLRVPLRLGIWDKGAQIHKQCPELTELGCLALALLEEMSQGSESARWPWLRVSSRTCLAILPLLTGQKFDVTSASGHPLCTQHKCWNDIGQRRLCKLYYQH